MNQQAIHPWHDLSELPLFACSYQNTTENTTKATLNQISNTLWKIIFPSPILLDAHFSFPERRENNSKIYLIWIDTSFNPERFIIEIHHSYTKTRRHSYTKWWNKWDRDWERAIYETRERINEVNKYVVRCDWWKMKSKWELHNYWMRIWKKSNLPVCCFSDWFIDELTMRLSNMWYI